LIDCNYYKRNITYDNLGNGNFSTDFYNTNNINTANKYLKINVKRNEFSSTDNQNNSNQSEKNYLKNNLKFSEEKHNNKENIKDNIPFKLTNLNKKTFSSDNYSSDKSISVLSESKPFEDIIKPANNYPKNLLHNSSVNQPAMSTIRKRSRLNSTAWKGSNYQEQEWVVSIIENYAREVGISAFNIRTMEFFISQFIDNEAYVNSVSMINLWRPLELVMNVKSEDSCLYSLIKKHFKNTLISLQARKTFAEDIGKEIYLNSGYKELTFDDLNTKYVCMASLSGLITYLETHSQIRIEKQLLHIKFFYLENHLNISFQTTLDLEILLNKKTMTKDSSLFSLFNCQTVSGMRLLRSNLLQPLVRSDDIIKRYEAVDELSNNTDVLYYIRQSLPIFRDLEINISKFLHKSEEISENTMRGILTAIQGLRQSLQHLQPFREILKHKLNSELFLNITKEFELPIYENLLEEIDKLIEDFDFTQTKVTRKSDSIYFLIKTGHSNVLDVSRKTYSDTINQIYSSFDKLKETSIDPNIKLVYTESSGYYLQIHEKYYNQSEYVVSKKVGKKFHCANIALLSLSERIKEIKRDLVDISIKIVSPLINCIGKQISHLYVLSSYLALLDMICAFAEFSKFFGSKTTRPLISHKMNKNSDSRYKNISHQTFKVIFCKNVINPVVFHSGLVSNFVPNDYFLSSHFNILMVKGANASGKTTYMKTLALNIILAQIGCFLPCDYFEFSPRKFLYTKFDSNDNVEENRGSFSKEIIEIQKVLCNQLNDALILLDEPFDNSQSLENTALSIAMLDNLTSENKMKSFVVLSSHNQNLSNIAQFYFNVVLGKMVVESSYDSLNFLYKFKFLNPFHKESPKEDYGIVLAKILGYDSKIIEAAKEISINTNNNKLEVFDVSEKVSSLKIFFFKLLLKIYELKYTSKSFLIQEEVEFKRKEITSFIKDSLMT
jgi:DNA mismatch repair protein MSH4